MQYRNLERELVVWQFNVTIIQLNTMFIYLKVQRRITELEQNNYDTNHINTQTNNTAKQ
jgi:hypothetical protein